MAGVWSEVSREWRHLPERIGGWSGVVLFAAMTTVLGVIVPRYLGFEFLSPSVLLAYGFVAPILAGPFLATAIAGEHERGRMLVAAKVIAAGLYGWTAAVIFLTAGLITVNLRNWHGQLLLPAGSSLGANLLLSLSLSLFAAAAGAPVALRAASVRQAKRSVRIGFLLVLLLLIATAKYAPWELRDWLAAQLGSDVLLRNALLLSALLLVGGALIVRTSSGGGNRMDL